MHQSGITGMRSVIALLLLLGVAGRIKGELIVSKLQVEALDQPLGIEAPAPRFSWQLTGEGRGISQSSYHILVASSKDLLAAGKADVWDSGEQLSAQSVDVPYGGRPLQSRQRCYWTVLVRDQQKNLLPAPAGDHFWEMGMLKPGDWKADWISAPKVSDWRSFAVSRETLGRDTAVNAAPLFRKEFTCKSAVQQARFYISGIGYNIAFFNGKEVGNQTLDPAFTRYDKTVLYRVFDVTELLQPGVNAAGVMLGNGWYNMQTRTVWGYDMADWRNQPALRAQLELLYADGSAETIITDNTWKTYPGPVYFNSVFQGEYYDARVEQKDWNQPRYNASDWRDVLRVAGPAGVLKSQLIPPVREVEVITPVTVTPTATSSYVLDIGKNIAGYARLAVKAPRGTVIELVYGERLKSDGRVDQEHIGMYAFDKPFQTDRYIAKGDGVEIWNARFTYHGFQYIEVSGLTSAPEKSAISAVVVHTDFEESGSFSSSNNLFNKILANARNSYLTNFHGYPTDCPHREKNGWMGDAHLASDLGLMNFDVAAAYKKWVADIVDEQQPTGELPGVVPTAGWGYFFGNGPAWDCSVFLIPWNVYLYRGDLSIVQQAYPAIKRYIDFVATNADKEHIVSWGLGDWCPANTKTPSEITSTAYYYVGSTILSKMAAVLGNDNDAATYSKLAGEIYQSFNRRFYKGKGIYGNGSQTALACALYQGLAKEHQQETAAALANLVKTSNYHLDCGILGTKYLLHALLDNGYGDAAYRVVNQTTFPSWGNWVAQGATTSWERWDGVNSRNHPVFGDVGAWFYKAFGGIRYDEQNPGFENVVIRPYFNNNLDWVKTQYQTRYGAVKVNWDRNANGIVCAIEVPHNSTATVELPVNKARSVLEKNGQPLLADAANIYVVPGGRRNITLKLKSGKYSFSFKPDVIQ